jgi:hypothetical protein
MELPVGHAHGRSLVRTGLSMVNEKSSSKLHEEKRIMRSVPPGLQTGRDRPGRHAAERPTRYAPRLRSARTVKFLADSGGNVLTDARDTPAAHIEAPAWICESDRAARSPNY